jgi:tetrahydromethanopterin S-methyltransferase subunit A
MLENECGLDVLALLAQEQRRAAPEASQVQEDALTRLQEQVQVLESQVQEAQQLTQALEILIRSDPGMCRDLQTVMGVGKSAAANSSPVSSFSMEGSVRDNSTLNVRGKMRKQRENASRFLSHSSKCDCGYS